MFWAWMLSLRSFLGKRIAALPAPPVPPKAGRPRGLVAPACSVPPKAGATQSPKGQGHQTTIQWLPRGSMKHGLGFNGPQGFFFTLARGPVVAPARRRATAPALPDGGAQRPDTHALLTHRHHQGY
jgi:hypothetical protein